METRGHSGGESRLIEVEMKSRGKRRYELFLHFLFVFTLQKKRERERLIKHLSFQEKLFNVVGIKGLKRGRGIKKKVLKWMLVKCEGGRGQETRGGGVTGSE